MKYRFTLLLPLACMFFFFQACKDEPKAPKKTGPADAFQFHKEGTLSFISDSSVLKQIDIEVADDEAERAQGLMNRPWMEETQGMLFIMELEERQNFWMRNTIIPLDIIYVSADKRIVSIAKDTQPFSEKSIPSAGPAKYVVEVIAGFSDKYGLKAGDRIEFEI